MNRKFFVLATLLTLLALLLSMPGTLAQEPEPPLPPKEIPGEPFPPFGGPIRTPDGLWVMPGGTRPPLEAADIRPLDTGGPDDFGYVWDDSVPFSWVDATSGTNTGLTGERQQVGPIALPFSFKYYENTYNQIYISTNGTLGFSGELTQDSQEWVFPKPSLPNNVIAPYWAPEDASTGGVYYTSGGTAPNRWWVVEWHQVRDYDADSRLTFEAILFENGDIEFRYHTINYGTGGTRWGHGVGIEDSVGLDGLEYTGYAKDNLAVRFTRPAASARVSLYPKGAGAFGSPGAAVQFQQVIRNNGELGTDTYDLFPTSSWPMTLYQPDGTTPLTDTDGDGTVDTGSLAQGSSATVVVKVTTPGIANVGDDNTAAVTVRSSLDTGKSKTVSLQTAVPAPFAQVFQDYADGAMSLYLVQPDVQGLKKVTSDYYYGYYMAVAEMPDSFAYFWTKSRSVDSVYVREIEYTLLDRYGNTVRGVSRLTDHSGATMSTYDHGPAVAVAPNGRIGVLWYNYLYDYGTGTSRSLYNIYFAVLDASGNVVVPPTNLTNNNDWYQYDPPTYNVPKFYDPTIAATDDNRFVLAWVREHEVPPDGGCSSYCYVHDIYYSVRDTSGAVVKPVTQFTFDTPGITGWGSVASHRDLNLATLSGSQALLTWHRGGGVCDVYYSVLDSGGNVVKIATNLVGDGNAEWLDEQPDAVQLSDGKIVVAWSGLLGGPSINYYIRFAVLDSAYNRIAGPTTLSNPAAVTGDDYVSVAADSAGHAILTWMDSDWDYRRNLYYALVDGNGNVLTDPMIFRTSQATDPRIETSYEGYGNTSYSWTPPSGVDVWIKAPSLSGGAPGGTATTPVRHGNYGATTATNVVLTATLDSNLGYAGASPTPSSASGNTVIWNLSDMAFLGGGQVALYTTVPSTTIGTRYPVTWTLTSAGPEANPSDNTATTEVMVARQVFLPLVARNY